MPNQNGLFYLQAASHWTDATEMQMSQNLEACYLIPGTIVQVLKNDPATKMSQIQFGVLRRR